MVNYSSFSGMKEVQSLAQNQNVLIHPSSNLRIAEYFYVLLDIKEITIY